MSYEFTERAMQARVEKIVLREKAAGRQQSSLVQESRIVRTKDRGVEPEMHCGRLDYSEILSVAAATEHNVWTNCGALHNRVQACPKRHISLPSISYLAHVITFLQASGL